MISVITIIAFVFVLFLICILSHYQDKQDKEVQQLHNDLAECVSRIVQLVNTIDDLKRQTEKLKENYEIK